MPEVEVFSFTATIKIIMHFFEFQIYFYNILQIVVIQILFLTITRELKSAIV